MLYLCMYVYNIATYNTHALSLSAKTCTPNYFPMQWARVYHPCVAVLFSCTPIILLRIIIGSESERIHLSLILSLWIVFFHLRVGLRSPWRHTIMTLWRPWTTRGSNPNRLRRTHGVSHLRQRASSARVVMANFCALRKLHSRRVLV